MTSSTVKNRQLAVSALAGAAVLFLGTSALADMRDHHPVRPPVRHVVHHMVHHVVHRPIHH